MSPEMAKALVSIFLSCLSLYILLCVGLYLFQGRLLYFPQKGGGAVPDSIGLSFEDLRIIASDGIELHAWFIPFASQSGTILYLHGNAGNISTRLQALRQLHDLGLNTLIVDYRGFGLSEGTPDEEGLNRDAEAAWTYLTKQRSIPPGSIILLGRSLGGAVAAALAVRHKPRALIMESTFTSVPDRGAELYPYLPVRLLSKAKYNTLGRMASITCPVLVVHSPEDEVIPFGHGERLFAAAREPKEFLQIHGAHDEGFSLNGFRYQQGIADFLDRHR